MNITIHISDNKNLKTEKMMFKGNDDVLYRNEYTNTQISRPQFQPAYQLVVHEIGKMKHTKQAKKEALGAPQTKKVSIHWYVGEGTYYHHEAVMNSS